LRAFVLAQLGTVELWTGDLDAAVDHLGRAHATARDGGHDWTAMAAGAHLAIARAFRGEIARALAHARAAVALAERRGWTRWDPPGAAYCVLAAVAIQRGRLDEATELVQLADNALRSTRDRPLRAAHALNRALVLSDRGDPEAALGVLQATRDEVGEWPLLPQLQEALVAQEALLRAALGEREVAHRLLERAEREAEAPLVVANALAKLRLLEGDAAAARTTLAPHLTKDGGVHDGGSLLSVRAEAWLLDALACDVLAEHDAAASSLEHSLDLADPGGLQRVLVKQGSRALPMLHRHMHRGTAHPAMVRAALQAIERRDRDVTRTAQAPLVERLSEREQSILRYLPTMMSNQEIAGELSVSVNTVKTHLKAIYRKLDAAGRRQAVERARDHGLLP
jgi:LuxR family maltose regulon positive regulatory protein